MVFKKCIVAVCGNTTENTTDKAFLGVPTAPERRRRWLDTIGYKFVKSVTLYFCEDHFNLKGDAANYDTFRRYGLRLLLKPNVVPHLYLTEAPIEPIQQFTDLEIKRKRKTLGLPAPPSPVFVDVGCEEDIDLKVELSISDTDLQWPEDIGIQVKPTTSTVATQTYASPANNLILNESEVKIEIPYDIADVSAFVKSSKSLSSHVESIEKALESHTASHNFQPTLLKIEEKPGFYLLQLPDNRFVLMKIISEAKVMSQKDLDTSTTTHIFNANKIKHV